MHIHRRHWQVALFCLLAGTSAFGENHLVSTPHTVTKPRAAAPVPGSLDPDQSTDPRWLQVGATKYYQYKNTSGDWITAKEFKEIPQGSDATLEAVNREGRKVTAAAGDVFYLDPRLGWKVAKIPKVSVEFKRDPQEDRFASRVLGKRPRMVRDTRLDFAAQQRAKMMFAKGGIDFHQIRSGIKSNYAVRSAGFPLHESQSDAANSVESIAQGPTSADGVWDMWVTREGPGGGHHDHILGTTFAVGHDHFGVGYYNGYWVYLSAKQDK